MTMRWRKRRIGEIATLSPSKSEARKRVHAGETVSFLPMEDLGVATIYPQARQTKQVSEVIGSYTYFADGDVLLAKITPCFENGKLGIARALRNGVGFGSSEFIVIRPNPTVCNEWLYYFLSREDFRAEGAKRMGGAVGQQRVPKEFVEAQELPIPSLPEQQRIVGVLSQALASVATSQSHAAHNIQQVRTLFESRLQAVFAKRGPGWVDKTLQEISTTFGRGKSKHRPRNAPELYGGRYPFVQTGDIRNADHVVTEYTQTYSDAGLAQSQLWPKGTLCITIAANIAETAILGFDACFPDSIVGVVVNPRDADVRFVEYLLQSFKARLQAMGKGSAQANINLGTFENERLPFPPLTVQKSIVAEVDALASEIARVAHLYEEKLAALAELRESLLHEAFAGNL